jgi:hypothetical protein
MGEWRNSCTILDLSTIWRSVVSFTPRALYHGESAPGTHWTGGLVGPRAVLSTVENKNACPCRDSNPGRPTRSPLNRLSYSDS